MKNDGEDYLNEVWETPIITVLDVNKKTENGFSGGTDDWELS